MSDELVKSMRSRGYKVRRVKLCANPTCTAPAGAKTYCSRRCQLAMRNVGGRGQLPDIWIGMDTERALHQRAATLGITVRDLIVNLLEPEIAQIAPWESIDLACRNCNGRKCMACVCRENHDECATDCPDCCAAPAEWEDHVVAASQSPHRHERWAVK